MIMITRKRMRDARRRNIWQTRTKDKEEKENEEARGGRGRGRGGGDEMRRGGGKSDCTFRSHRRLEAGDEAR